MHVHAMTPAEFKTRIREIVAETSEQPETMQALVREAMENCLAANGFGDGLDLARWALLPIPQEMQRG